MNIKLLFFILDKLLDEIHLEFRDRYKNELKDGSLWLHGCDFESGMEMKYSQLLDEKHVFTTLQAHYSISRTL